MTDLPRSLDEMWAENGAAWKAVGRAWLMWLACVVCGALLMAVYAPLGLAVIALGFSVVGYAIFVVVRYGRRQKRFLLGRLSVNDVRYFPALRVRAEGIITDLQVRSVDAEMALRALAGWIRDYARLKDWDAYPQELLDAEKVLDRRGGRHDSLGLR